MKARILILLGIAIAFFSVPVHCQSIDSAEYVKQFPGNDVGTKVKNAIAACPQSPQPCILVLDPSLALWAPGVMPTLPANATLYDYRVPGSTFNLPGVSSDGANGEKVSGAVQAGSTFIAGTSLQAANLKAFGAKGDGISNDTTAIVNWITSAIANKTALYIPQGTYLTDPITTLNVPGVTGLVIFGDGPTKSILKSRTGGDVFSLTGATSYASLTLRDFGIQGNGGTGRGFFASVASPYLLMMDNIWVSNTGGAGIKTVSDFESYFKGVVITGTAGNAFDIQGGNTTTFVNTYVQDLPTAGTVGYRIHSGQVTMISANGINTAAGGNVWWGIFGDNVAEDGVVQYAYVNLLGSNIEGFGQGNNGGGIRTKYGSSVTATNASFLGQPSVTNQVALQFDGGYSMGTLSGSTSFAAGSGSTAKNGYLLHSTNGDAPFVASGHGGVTTYYDDQDSVGKNLVTLNQTGLSNAPISGSAITTSTIAMTRLSYNYRALTSASSPYALHYTNSDVALVADASGGAVTVNLDASSFYPTGTIYVLEKTDSSANVVSIIPYGTQTINGGTGNCYLRGQWQSLILMADGANWKVIQGQCGYPPVPSYAINYHGNSSDTQVQGSDGTGTSGHVAVYDSGGGLTDGGKAPAVVNTAVLVSGTVTVNNAAACTPGASCTYSLAHCGVNASTAIGVLSIGTVTAGTSFVINSLSSTGTVVTGDLSTVCWQIN